MHQWLRKATTELFGLKGIGCLLVLPIFDLSLRVLAKKIFFVILHQDQRLKSLVWLRICTSKPVNCVMSRTSAFVVIHGVTRWFTVKEKGELSDGCCIQALG